MVRGRRADGDLERCAHQRADIGGGRANGHDFLGAPVPGFRQRADCPELEMAKVPIYKQHLNAPRFFKVAIQAHLAFAVAGLGQLISAHKGLPIKLLIVVEYD